LGNDSKNGFPGLRVDGQGILYLTAMGHESSGKVKIFRSSKRRSIRLTLGKL